MLVAVNKYHYNIWGIDQEYQMAFTYVFNKAFHSQSPKFKAKYQAVYDSLIAKWWMPDDVQFIDAIPHGATGKILKTALRKQFEDYKLPA